MDMNTRIGTLNGAERDAIYALAGGKTIRETAGVVGLNRDDVEALAKSFGWPDLRHLKTSATAIRANNTRQTSLPAGPARRPTDAGAPDDLDPVVDRTDDLEAAVLRHRSETPTALAVEARVPDDVAAALNSLSGGLADVAGTVLNEVPTSARPVVTAAEPLPVPEDGLAGQLRPLDALAGVENVSGRPSATLTMPLLWLHGADGLLAVISEAIAEVTIRPRDVLAHLQAGTPMPLKVAVTQRLTSAGRLHIAELAALLEHDGAPA